MGRLKLCLLVGLTAGLTGCAANPAQDMPGARVGTPTPSTSSATSSAAPGVKLPLTEATEIKWSASKVTRTHEGGFGVFQGEVNLVEQDPAKSSVDVRIMMDSVWADDPDLADHLATEDFFDVDRYPESRFVSSRIAKTAKGYDMTGDLTLHGVTNSITFPATIEVGPGPVVKARAEFFIKRFDWKIMYPGKADNLIRNEVVIHLDLVAGPPGARPAGAEEAGAGSGESGPDGPGSAPASAP